MTTAQNAPEGVAFPEFVRKGIVCTALLWAATAGIHFWGPAWTPHAWLPRLTPTHAGIILSLLSTVIVLCAFVNTTAMRRRSMWLICVPWLAFIFAVTDRTPAVPTKIVNAAVFLALAVCYLRRADVKRRGRRPRRATA